MIKGFDISSYQSHVDFASLKSAGYDFVIIKASQGINIFDSMYQTHYKNAKAVGLIIGAYHFQDADYDGYKQYNFFKSCINGTNPDFYALDIEDLNKSWTATQINNVAKAFMLSVDKPTLLYTRPEFILEHSPQMVSWIVNYPNWVAYYGPLEQHKECLLNEVPSQAPFPYWSPLGWPFKTTKWWQWSGDCYTVKECDGAMDLNTYDGTLDDLKAWCGPTTVLPNPPPIPPVTVSGLVATALQNMNIRSGPSISNPIVGSLNKGVAQTVLDINGNDVWVKISNGWICYKQGTTSYLTLARN